MKNFHILVVEDDPVMQAFLEMTLLEQNYQISLSNNGKEELEMTKTLSPDLIITDLQMPVMDGIDMAKNVRKLKKFKDLPIIILTAFNQDINRKKAMAIGVNEYVLKPVNMKTFLKKIHFLLEGYNKSR